MHLYVLLFCYFLQKLDFGRTLNTVQKSNDNKRCARWLEYGGMHQVDACSNKQANVLFPSVVQFLFSSCIARKKNVIWLTSFSWNATGWKKIHTAHPYFHQLLSLTRHSTRGETSRWLWIIFGVKPWISGSITCASLLFFCAKSHWLDTALNK